MGDRSNKEASFPSVAIGISGAEFNPDTAFRQLEHEADQAAKTGDTTAGILLNTLKYLRENIAPKTLRIASVARESTCTCMPLYEPDNTLIGYVPLIAASPNANLLDDKFNPGMSTNINGYRTAQMSHELMHCLADMKLQRGFVVYKGRPGTARASLPYTFGSAGFCPVNSAAVIGNARDSNLAMNSLKLNLDALNALVPVAWLTAAAKSTSVMDRFKKQLPYHLSYIAQKITHMYNGIDVEYDGPLTQMFILCFQSELCRKEKPFYRALGLLSTEITERLDYYGLPRVVDLS